MPSTSASTSAFLPIVACQRVEYRDALLSTGVTLEAFSHVWDPRVDVRFVVCATSGSLTLGYEAVGTAPGEAADLLTRLREMLAGTSPWLGTLPVTAECPWPPPGPLHSSFTLSTADSETVVPHAALAWRAVLASPELGSASTWHLAIDLVAPMGVAPSGASGIESGSLEGGEDGIVDLPGTDSRFAAEVRLHGTGPMGRTLAALICADGSEAGRLAPLAGVAGRAERRTVVVPTRLLAHLLAAPARLNRGVLPEQLPRPSRDLMLALSTADTAHLLTVGVSGGGKTTLGASVAADHIAQGKPVVCVDIHDGDLVRRLYAHCLASGRDVLYVDLRPGLQPTPPCLPLVMPLPGMTPDQWVEALLTFVRWDLFPEAPEDWFGPVGMRSTRTGLSLSAWDPARRFGMSQIPRLLDASQRAFRRDVLRRVGDVDLERTVEQELIPMTSSRDAGNAMTWTNAKFAPFSTEAVRQFLESWEHRIPLEEALRRGTSVLVHAPAGDIGQEGARIIAGLVYMRTDHTARRGGAPRGVMALMDEWPQYASRTTTSMLAEGRKFGVRVVAMNQFLGQLSPTVREAVLSNAGAVAAFRVSPHDAVYLDPIYPTIPVRTLSTLPPRSFAFTTFDRDYVLAGPEPLPTFGGEVPDWGDQLRSFWGGAEPEPPSLPVRATVAPDEDGDTTELEDDTVLDRWLLARSRRARAASDATDDNVVEHS